MLLIEDIKQDQQFKKSLKIIGFACVCFFIIDGFTGNFLTKGLEKFYGLNTGAEIALIGHSHLMLGIDKNLLEKELGVQVAKYTRPGVNIADRQIMVRHLLKLNSDVKIIIYGVDAWMFTGEGLSVNSHTLFYPFMGIKEVESYVSSQAGFGNYWLHKIVKTARFDEGLISSALRGYLHNWSNLKYGEVDTGRLKKEIAAGEFRRINNSQGNINMLKQTIKELEEQNIQVIFLYVPTIDLFNRLEPEKFKETLDIINEFEKEFSNVQVLNYIEPFSHDHSLFFDPIHLNPKGQEMVTKELIKDLKEK